MSESTIERRHGEGCECVRCAGFQAGNGFAVRHGSYARLSEDPRVQEWFDHILETQPVSHPCDAGAAWRLAMVYRRLEISDAALVEADRAAAEHPTAAYSDKAAWLDRLRADHDRWQSRAGKIEDQLGRNPSARSRLGLRLALAERTLADLAATGREIRERRGIGAGDE